MRKKIQYWLFTFNLSVLLVFNEFFIILLVLAVVAGAGWLAVEFGWMRLDQMLTPAAVMAVVFSVALLIGISVVCMLQLVILKPVRGMVGAMQRLAGGDFSVRMTCDGWMRPLELREFTAAFNKAAEELGGTEILRKDFINNFSHEFKTPITSIGGFAALLLEDEEMPPEERREYLSIIAAESGRLAGLANSVLALSRVEAQSILTDAAPFPLAEQLRQCALLVQQKWADKKETALTVELPEDGECVYTGSAALLKEVWVNLLDNAFKFTPAGGTVALAMHRDAQGVTVTVRDDGPGMDEATQARVFDQFYQGDTSHKTEGNGLGLAMAQKIAALHGGRITIQSAPGRGSTFTVNLPQGGG